MASSYVLDTNVVSALMRGERDVEERLLRQQPNEVFLVQPVVAEVEYGLARLPRSRKRSELVSASAYWRACSRARTGRMRSARFWLQ